jgi:quercetin dioxygenase-like cupin family protein
VKGLEVADIIGDATKPGPYVQRVKFPPNFTVQAHTHPEDRQYTIISGTWYVGWGNKFDESKLKALPAGSFYTEPNNVPHFVTTKGEPAIVQITGTGPTAVKYVDPAHAPKK